MVLLGSPPGKVWPNWVLMRKGGGLVASPITRTQYLTQNHMREEGLFGPQFERVQSVMAGKKLQNEYVTGTP